MLLVIGSVLSGCADSDTRDRPKSVCELFGDDGRAEHPKIINGTACSAESVPVATISLYDEEDNRDQCSGVLIASRFVLSAAHCIHEAIVRVTVGFGDKTYGIKRALVHPLFQMSGDRFLNDLVLYELDKPAEGIMPIELARQETIAVGTNLYIFGYGYATAGTLPISELGILRGGMTTVASVDADFITTRYQEGGTTTCFGDSGGPAIVLREDIPLLVGVTSSGTNSACAVGDRSLFVNVLGPRGQGFVQDVLGSGSIVPVMG